MTQDRDLDRLLSQWLGEGPSEVPDRVIDVVADRIGHQAQRPAWRFQGRPTVMNLSLRAAAVLAAVSVVAIGAIYFFGLSSGPDVGGPKPTASPSPAASATSTASPPTISSTTFKPLLSLVHPTGWTVSDGDRTFILDAPTGSSGVGGSIGLMSGPFATFQDRDCNNEAPAGVGASVAEVVGSLVADPRVTTSPPEAVTVGGRTGQMVDIKVAPSWTGICAWSGGKPAVIILSATDTGPAFGLGESEQGRFIFLDVGESVVAINIGTPDASNFDQFVAQAMPTVESMQFTP
jgi:hypothetical protein